MYRTAYQSGPSMDIFGPTGTKPCRLWNVNGNVSRSYDKQANGLAVNLSGHSAKMSFPKTKAGLHLTQRYAVFQLKLSPDKQFSMELAITTKDNTSTRRRLTISSSFKSRKFAPLTAQIPLGVQSVMDEARWVSLCIDLEEVVDMAWAGGGGFRSLESISLGGEQPRPQDASPPPHAHAHMHARKRLTFHSNSRLQASEGFHASGRPERGRGLPSCSARLPSQVRVCEERKKELKRRLYAEVLYDAEPC